jgi:hypothetical protein
MRLGDTTDGTHDEEGGVAGLLSSLSVLLESDGPLKAVDAKSGLVLPILGRENGRARLNLLG